MWQVKNVRRIFALCVLCGLAISAGCLAQVVVVSGGEVASLASELRYYTDRQYLLIRETLPAELREGLLIRTPNDKKAVQSYRLVLDFGEPGDLYVLLDRRAVAVPAWLAGATKCPWTVAVTDANMMYFDVWKLPVSPGRLELGPNAAGASMFSAVFVALSGAVPFDWRSEVDHWEVLIWQLARPAEPDAIVPIGQAIIVEWEPPTVRREEAEPPARGERVGPPVVFSIVGEPQTELTYAFRPGDYELAVAAVDTAGLRSVNSDGVVFRVVRMATPSAPKIRIRVVE